jgi:hypothetical protein
MPGEDYRAYVELLNKWRQQWEEMLKKNPKQKWYEVPNPAGAKGYPPGFLKKDLKAFAICESRDLENTGFVWLPASQQYKKKIGNQEDLKNALKTYLEKNAPNSLDMLILSGHTPNHSTKHIGMKFGKGDETVDLPKNNLDERMDDETVDLIKKDLKPEGILVFASCNGGGQVNDRESEKAIRAAFQRLKDRIGHDVAGAAGYCYGVEGEEEYSNYGMSGWSERGYRTSWEKPAGR